MHVRVALLAGTYDEVDPRLKTLFRSASVLVHGGNVCDARTLAEIKNIVPGATVLVVRGKDDREPFASPLPEHAYVDVQGVRLLCAADEAAAEAAIAARPDYARARVVVTGGGG